MASAEESSPAVSPPQPAARAGRRKKVPCPDCGYANPVNAVYCQLCQKTFREKTRRGHRHQIKIEKRRDFFTEIKSNKRQTVFLMIVFGVVVGGLGATFGYYYGVPEYGVGFAVLVAGILMMTSWYQGGRMLLALSGAKEVTTDMPEHRQLRNVVEEMVIAGGLPAVPKVYLINDTAPNAFATGRDPHHSAVAVTRGLVEKLNREELQAVIAHEISHIRNYDIRFMMVAGVLVGTVALLSDFFLRSIFYGRGHRRTSTRRDGGSAIFLLIGLVFALLAPVCAKMLQLAVSRQREFLADASAAQLTRNPNALANALEKIAADPEPLEVANRATQHLYISNPVKTIGMKANKLFATHPPIEARVRILRSMHF